MSTRADETMSQGKYVLFIVNVQVQSLMNQAMVLLDPPHSSCIIQLYDFFMPLKPVGILIIHTNTEAMCDYTGVIEKNPT